MKEYLIVSACFLSDGYKYDGTNNINNDVLSLKDKYEFVVVCPEVFGGLPTPRIPAEQKEGKVYFKDGKDVTEYFIKGAQKSLEKALEHNCKKAILKAKSPSCGKGQIYDGTFTHIVINGNGVLADLLIKNGIEVYTENEIDKLK